MRALQGVFSALVIVPFLVVNSYALENTSKVLSTKQPVMLTAEQMDYDSKTAIATANGHVEVIQGEMILLADHITYNQNTDTVHATGNVSVTQPNGDVVFSDDATLNKAMQTGVIQQFRARLSDNSLFAAREARKINKNVTQLQKVVYSPCHVCAIKEGEKSTAPLWQMKAESVTIDEEKQRVRYKDAVMEIYGVPVAYTPYFSHPTPDAPSQSGLLLPQYFHSSNIGNVIKQPVFLSLQPNMDLTVTPWYMSRENPLLQGEFRHLMESGAYEVNGAITNAHNRDANGDIISGSEVRYYIDAHGRWKLSDHWSAGIDGERTSDNTFLQLYGLGWQTLLTSRLYAERIEDRNYASIEALAFQGLQSQDIASQSPYILPQTHIHLEQETGFANSHTEIEGNTLVLERQQGNSDRRISGSGSWKIPYITKDGQVIEASATLRADGYSVSNQTINTTDSTFNGTTGRILPELQLDWRYPLIKPLNDHTSLMIAPMIQIVESPNLRNSFNIPNEDSQIAELSDVNLFSADRFSGYDKVESGLRGTYGVRGNLQFASDKYIEWLFGESYQQNQNSPFPIAAASAAHFSDYIGYTNIRYKWIDLAYSFRLDRDTLSPTSNEIITSFHLAPVSISATYISLHNEPLFGDHKEIFGNASVDLTDNWRWNLSGRKDLGTSTATSSSTSTFSSLFNILDPTNGTVGVGTGLEYHNECMMVTLNFARNYIAIQDVRPASTFSVDVVLKNFGLPQPAVNPGNTAPGTERTVAPAEPTNKNML